MRRGKKSILVFIAVFLLGYLVIRMDIFSASHYMPLRVLQNAESEARRLLKLFNAKNYMCNNSYIVGNRSMAFPICLDNNGCGITLEKSRHDVVYSIGLGPEDDFTLEHSLAINYSFPVFIITHQKLSTYLYDANNTYYVPARIVPNDYADFSRNSYSQHTINDIILMLKHERIDIMKIWSVPPGVHMWELLYYMVRDGLLSKVKQLHFHIYINTIDEDLLYNWYRTLYSLFYKANFALYHVSASSPLCLQVTLMESCSYFLSWIRDPGPQTFLMHPPADLGSQSFESDRLLDFIRSKRVTCSELYDVEQAASNQLTVTVPPSWTICVDDLNKHVCRIYSFSSDGRQRSLEKAINKDLQKKGKCEVHHMVPKVVRTTTDLSNQMRRITSFQTKNKKEVDVMAALYTLSSHNHVSVVEINLSGYTEWALLQTMLDAGCLMNTSQVLIKITLSSPEYGRHPKILRREFSQLKQLEKQGFHLFHSSPCTDSISVAKHNKEDPDCYQLGFSRTESIYYHPGSGGKK